MGLLIMPKRTLTNVVIKFWSNSFNLWNGLRMSFHSFYYDITEIQLSPCKNNPDCTKYKTKYYYHVLICYAQCMCIHSWTPYNRNRAVQLCVSLYDSISLLFFTYCKLLHTQFVVVHFLKKGKLMCQHK